MRSCLQLHFYQAGNKRAWKLGKAKVAAKSPWEEKRVKEGMLEVLTWAQGPTRSAPALGSMRKGERIGGKAGKRKMLLQEDP